MGQREPYTSQPQHLQSLSLIPLVQIAAGGEQSFALSVSGGVFGWGRNDCGQLGLGNRTGTKTTKTGKRKMKKESNSIHTLFFFAICTFLQYKNLTYYILSADQDTPTPVDCLIMKKTVYISCGKDHTVILTKVRHRILVTALAHQLQANKLIHNNNRRC